MTAVVFGVAVVFWFWIWSNICQEHKVSSVFRILGAFFLVVPLALVPTYFYAKYGEWKERQEQAPAPVKIFAVQQLNGDEITKELPLKNLQVTESGNGRLKQFWEIEGIELGAFEVIGNHQADADVVAWRCAEYDEAGNYASPFREGSQCHGFFVAVLQKVVDEPQILATELLKRAQRMKPEAAIWGSGQISVETDGQFYFLRRTDRMN